MAPFLLTLKSLNPSLNPISSPFYFVKHRDNIFTSRPKLPMIILNYFSILCFPMIFFLTILKWQNVMSNKVYCRKPVSPPFRKKLIKNVINYNHVVVVKLSASFVYVRVLYLCRNSFKMTFYSYWCSSVLQMFRVRNQSTISILPSPGILSPLFANNYPYFRNFTFI